MQIVLDANFLMLPGQKKIDVFKELDRILEEPWDGVVLDVVLDELKHLSKGSTKDARAAKIGAQLIEKKGFRVVETRAKNTDAAIIGYSIAHKAAVATLDQILQKKLKGFVPIIRLKGKILVVE